MFAWALVAVGMAPRVHGNSFHLEIRSVPVRRVFGLTHQLLEPVLALGIKTIVHFKRIQRRAERGDLRNRRRDSRLFGAAGKLRHHDRRENAQDHKHEQKFDEREGAVRAEAGSI